MATGYRDPKSVRVSLGAFDAPSTLLDGVIDRDPRPWLRLSIGAAALAAVGSAIALRDVERFYGTLTTSFTDQAIAQDLVNLFFVSPLMALLAWRGLRNSLASYLVWLGFLTFTVYNYAIYAFSIDFGPLFLLWVAVLGMATFSLIGGASAVVPTGVANALGNRKERFTAVFLLLMTAVFAALWLSDIVPALVDGSTPESVLDVGLPTNPVHVLDLAFFLPAVGFVGWSLLQRHPLGYAAAPAMLVFLALTGLPVLTTVFVADHYGHDAAWQLLAPIGVITVTSAILTWVMVHDLRLRR
jgi:hypothetical protein